jgi:hypothetical protein
LAHEEVFETDEAGSLRRRLLSLSFSKIVRLLFVSCKIAQISDVLGTITQFRA